MPSKGKSVQRSVPAIVFWLCLAGPALGGTYETLDGKRHEIMTTNGNLHSRKGHVGPGANLRWADLHRANLGEANLKWADLRNANLENATLIKADLSGAYLAGADLRGANLLGAGVNGADLSGTDLRGAKHWDKVKTWNGSYYYRGSEPEWPAGMDPKKLGIIKRERPRKKPLK